MKLVECVPNFSEGRDPRVIEAIADAVRGVSGVRLLDVDPGNMALGAVAAFGWAFAVGFVLFFAVKKTVGLRVSKEEELRGLDITEHGSEAYAGFQIYLNQ